MVECPVPLVFFIVVCVGVLQPIPSQVDVFAAQNSAWLHFSGLVTCFFTRISTDVFHPYNSFQCHKTQSYSIEASANHFFAALPCRVLISWQSPVSKTRFLRRILLSRAMSTSTGLPVSCEILMGRDQFSFNLNRLSPRDRVILILDFSWGDLSLTIRCAHHFLICPMIVSRKPT